jgi:hypothetical protein
MLYVPIPEKKDNEKQNDYMGRCMEFMKDEKYPQKQKVAICLNTFGQPKKKSKANEIEIDFSEDIKKMNKQKETKVEEVPKIEVKPEQESNTAVTAPPEVKIEQA